MHQPDILSFKILSASNGTDVQPAALCHHSPPQKPAASKLPETPSPLNSKSAGISSTSSRLDLIRRPDHDNLEDHPLVKCWNLIVRPEKQSERSEYGALLSQSSWDDFVCMCQYYKCELDARQDSYKELLATPSNSRDPFAKALTFWQSAMELERRRNASPLHLYSYRWQLLRFRSSILEIARPPQATDVSRKRSTHGIPRLEIIAIVEKMLRTPSNLPQDPSVKKRISDKDDKDRIAEGINKFDEAEHLHMMSKTFGVGVLALIPPSWRPFPWASRLLPIN